jgi:hypothetical protein
MEDFISGVLRENNPGAIYPEDTTWNRWLILQYSEEDSMEIFDPNCISSELKIGECYRVIVPAWMVVVRCFPNNVLGC